MSHEGLPPALFAYPGPLRDRLVAAILRGEKTSTSSLLDAYEAEGERLPREGERAVVLDSDERPVAVIEMTEVRVVRLADVDLAFARDEGEGFETVAQWREAHERFWARDGWTVDDDTQVVAERFRLVERLDEGPGPGP